MIATSFPESNNALSRPPGMTDEECEALSVYRGLAPDGHSVVISCFKATREEREEFLRTGRIWLWVWGQTMPPVALGTQNPFEAPKERQ